MDLNDYIGPFIDETEDNLQRLNEYLLAFEEGDKSVINEIFRVAHTLKGMAGTMGFNNMAALTHTMEDVLDGVRNNKFHLRREEDISLLFECLDTLNQFLEEIRDDKGDGAVDTTDITEKLKNILLIGEKEEVSKESCPKDIPLDQTTRKIKVELRNDCMLKGARAMMIMEEVSSLGKVESTDPEMETLLDGKFPGNIFFMTIDSQASADEIVETVQNVSEVHSCSVEELDVGNREGTSGREKDSTKKVNEKIKEDKVTDAVKSIQKKTNQTVRVDVQRLDKLLNLVGELVIGRSRIERLARDADFKEFEEPIMHLGRISKDIQDMVTKLRMLPISFIFDRFPRLVRDLSHNLEKKVSLELEGRDTELDRSVIDEIGDPMVHLIRNSLDHGIEPPKERLAAGKSETGRLRVRAYQDGSSVVVAVEDDGKGIDKNRIVAKAIEKGIITEEQAEKATDREALQFLFIPGFSTTEVVSDISGRGVGMDAVKNKVESLGGRIFIESENGEGTSVKIKLPITLAIVLALLITINGNIYAIPLESVDETIKVDLEQVKVVNGSLVTMLRGSILNLVDARKFYGLPEEEKGGDLSVVVMRTGFRRIGFIVDDFVGQQEIVIKNLGNTGGTKIKWFSGGTILGDGSVALIIDPAAVDENS